MLCIDRPSLTIGALVFAAALATATASAKDKGGGGGSQEGSAKSSETGGGSGGSSVTHAPKDVVVKSKPRQDRETGKDAKKTIHPPSTSVGNVGSRRPSGPGTADGGPAKTSTGGAPAPPPASGGANKQITTTPVGPARSSGTTDTIKTGGTGPAPSPQSGGRDLPPALAPSAAAITDEAADPKRSGAAGAPKAAVGAANPAERAVSEPPPKSAAAAIAPAAVAVAVAAAASAAVYRHNNSTMKFIPEGDGVRVIYDKPRGGLDALGIKAGTPLFEGKKTGPNSYAGEATTFSRNCGTAKFPVAGQSDGGVVTLRGEKPKRGGDCKVTGYSSETLVFEANGKP